MVILFDINHPAHVHLFKNFILYLKAHNHDVTVTSRDKDLTLKLLDYYKIPYYLLTKQKNTRIGMLSELINRDLQIFGLNNKKKFDLSFGTSISIAHLSVFTKTKSYCFADDDDRVIPLYAYLTYPFATKIINPIGTKYKKWTKKRVLYSSYQKLAYLHPDNFKPNIEVLKKYNLKPYKYILTRHSALKAHHDTNALGINENLLQEIKNVTSQYRLVDSTENINGSIDPWDMHHILAFAKLFISDSQSMTVEASVLGVPNIRFNTFVGKISCLSELENKYQLTIGLKPGEEDKVVLLIKKMLVSDNLNKLWQNRQNNMLKEKVNFNTWLINYFETELNK